MARQSARQQTLFLPPPSLSYCPALANLFLYYLCSPHQPPVNLWRSNFPPPPPSNLFPLCPISPQVPASLPPSVLLRLLSSAVLLLQLRSQLFPASGPSFSWGGSPPLPGAPSLPGFGGQPADVAQHLVLLHRQGEVMSRLRGSALPACAQARV